MQFSLNLECRLLTFSQQKLSDFSTEVCICENHVIVLPVNMFMVPHTLPCCLDIICMSMILGCKNEFLFLSMGINKENG